MDESFNSEIVQNLSKFKIDSKSGKIDGSKAAFSKDEHDDDTENL